MWIRSIKVKNFKVFKNMEMENIPDFCVLIGANATGKTTLFEIFEFLQRALDKNVEVALDELGGFEQVRSYETTGPISIELKFLLESGKASTKNLLVTYFIEVNETEDGNVYVKNEYLEYEYPARKDKTEERWRYFDFKEGVVKILKNRKGKPTERIYDDKLLFLDFLNKDVEDRDRIVEQVFGFIKKIYTSKIHIAKSFLQYQRVLRPYQRVRVIRPYSKKIRPYSRHSSFSYRYIGEKTLLPTGVNLIDVIKYFYDEHKEILNDIADKLAKCVPDINKVKVVKYRDGGIVIELKDENFEVPFLAEQVSDGTIKLLTYLVLLNEPQKHSVLCVEEPENQLYHKLIGQLSAWFRKYANEKGGRQVFIVTHSPRFIDDVDPENVFWLKKDKGYVTAEYLAKKDKDNEDNEIKRNVDSGAKLGELWEEGYFGQID